MGMKEKWISLVYKLLHFGFDLFSEIEKKDFDGYLKSKISRTLKGKQLNCLVFDNGDGTFTHKVDDLKSEMILYLLENKAKLLKLSPAELWKKFNNKAYGYLQEKYYKREKRHLDLGVGSSAQIKNDYSNEELEERLVVFSELEAPVINIPEEKEIYDGDCVIYDSDGNVVKVKKAKKRKK